MKQTSHVYRFAVMVVYTEMLLSFTLQSKCLEDKVTFWSFISHPPTTPVLCVSLSKSCCIYLEPQNN